MDELVGRIEIVDGALVKAVTTLMPGFGLSLAWWMKSNSVACPMRIPKLS